jgi:hypothetical protein
MLLQVRGIRARVSGKLIVTETKTSRSRRVVPLSPTAERLLRDVRANHSPLVFARLRHRSATSTKSHRK